MDYKDTLVKSVKDYLEWIENATEAKIKSDDGVELDFGRGEMYYRGQACKYWDLNPSVFRQSLFDEHELLRKASLQLWKELSVFTSYLEKIVYLQHYGMPTRLLDVTFNPLTALYFACLPSKCNEGGVVYCGSSHNNENERIAELVSEFLFRFSLDNVENDIKDFAKEKGESIEKFCWPIFILPPINNPRIEHQNGAFVMTSLLTKGKGMITLCHDTLNDSGFFSEKRALIPETFKFEITRELHRLGVNKGSIYQGVVEKIETIVLEEQWKSENLNIVI